jgi:hypothetical protein
MRELVFVVDLGVRHGTEGPFTFAAERIKIPIQGQTMPTLTKQVIELLTKTVVDSPNLADNAQTKTLREIGNQESALRSALAEWRHGKPVGEIHSWYGTHCFLTIEADYLER